MLYHTEPHCMIDKSAMLQPILYGCIFSYAATKWSKKQGSNLWNIGDILCLQYHLFPVMLYQHVLNMHPSMYATFRYVRNI
jgi:hypothetical protein